MSTCFEFFMLIFLGMLMNTVLAQDTIRSDKQLNDVEKVGTPHSKIGNSNEYKYYITFAVTVDSLGNVLYASVVKKI